MTPQVALARIAALCDDAESGDYPTLPAKSFVRTVRKVLAEVTSETGCTLDRDQARDVLLGVGMPRVGSAGAPVVDDALLDALAACVRPATIDCAALSTILRSYGVDGDALDEALDRIEAIQ